ncbi:DUF3578 domain-containing protein [Haloferax sp. MBLA0076]|uniref:DUF3578 domain-containing protein n=1 Tax=Haloferax litoreum TaxID=2666140 RepID=A0A6A8GFE1_9EURY|nr:MULTISPECIES: DUF3578 domain-containing protein [Haloferax]KAB1193365.1 DUF3578 domain-containing protein [Haloferax sp. CBA1148]MRX21873.1 DUF3578 domain-containing protein [Haloferax litoreum]
MSEWRDTIRAEITRYCDQHDTQEFDLQDLLAFSESTLREKFPDNNTWEATTRRTLQELRDAGELDAKGNGRYRVENLSAPSSNNSSESLPIPHSSLNMKAQYALTHFLEAKSEEDWDHPVVSLINSELPGEFQSKLKHDAATTYGIEPEHLNVRGSSGTGRMANIPWIGVFDQRVAEGPQDGLYVVYLFDTVEDRLFLTLNQGMTQLKDNYGLGATKEVLSKRAEILRTRIDLDRFEMESIELPSQLLTGRNKYYGDSTICYRSYDASQFPSENDLVIDLCELVASYQEIVESGFYQSLLDSFDEENVVQRRPGSSGLTEETSDSSELESSEDMRQDTSPDPSIWIEKTQVANRPYKQKGEFKLGKAIMSPSRDKGGQKRYEAMREAEAGDIVLHLLQDQHQIVGISVIDSALQEDFEGPPDDRWTEEQQVQGGYLRWLKDYQGIEPHIHVYKQILENPEYQDRLREIREESGKIFYSKRLSLNQGHYFTQCPDELVKIFVEESPHLANLLEERGYDLNGDIQLPPADQYDGIKEATKDIRARIDQVEGAQNWLNERLAETIVRDWTEALRRSDLIDAVVTATDSVKCEQIVDVYEDHRIQLKELADEIGSGTIKNSSLNQGEVLFVVLLRDLQSEVEITPNMNHVKFKALLQGRHRGDGGDILTPPDRQPSDTDTIERQLEQAQQLVFYGPPGTGKTYTARQFAHWWLNQQSDHTPTTQQLETVTFHPSFSYEDFIEGLTAEADDGMVEYRIQAGVFKRICQRAETAYQHAKQNDDLDEARRFVLIVDEINRGNLAQIFGETITLLESDKRLDQPNEVEITLSHSREPFTVPPNLYVIGTMNTADRSIALVDAALRRRFRFLAFPPNYSVLIDHHDFESLGEIQEVAQTSSDPYQSLVALSVLAVRELNETIVDTPDLGKGKQIGHSYLMNLDEAADIVDAWKFEILPLLEEYYFGQFERIREELFQASGGRLFHWESEEISDFTRDDLRRALAEFVDIDLVEEEVNGSADDSSETIYTLNLLLEENVLQSGDELVFSDDKVPEESNRPYDSSDPFWRCEVTGKSGQSNGVRWLFNDEEYSFSGLARAVLEQVSDHDRPVSGPDYWRHPAFDNKRLDSIRSEVQSGTLTNADREH